MDQPLTRLPRLAAVEENRRGGRVLAEFVGRVGKHVGIALVEHEAVARQPDRAGHERGAGASPEPGAGELESRDRARHPDREIAAPAARRDRVAAGIEVHGGRRRGGRGLAEIDEGGASVMEADGHEPAAAKIAGFGEGDRQRIADGNGGIDRIAAGLEHVDPGLGRQPVGADDHAMLGSDRRRRRGVRGRRPRHRQGAHHCREEAQPLANHPIPPVKKEGSRSPPLKSIVQAINI